MVLGGLISGALGCECRTPTLHSHMLSQACTVHKLLPLHLIHLSNFDFSSTLQVLSSSHLVAVQCHSGFLGHLSRLFAGVVFWVQHSCQALLSLRPLERIFILALAESVAGVKVILLRSLQLSQIFDMCPLGTACSDLE